MQEFDAEVGKRVRALREKLGYSREKLSELAEVSTKFIYEIEVGKKGMSAYTLFNLSKSLGVSCDYLLTGKGESNSFGYIENALSTMSNEEILHVEQIVKHISSIALINKQK